LGRHTYLPEAVPTTSRLRVVLVGVITAVALIGLLFGGMALMPATKRASTQRVAQQAGSSDCAFTPFDPSCQPNTSPTVPPTPPPVAPGSIPPLPPGLAGTCVELPEGMQLPPGMTPPPGVKIGNCDDKPPSPSNRQTDPAEKPPVGSHPHSTPEPTQPQVKPPTPAPKPAPRPAPKPEGYVRYNTNYQSNGKTTGGASTFTIYNTGSVALQNWSVSFIFSSPGTVILTLYPNISLTPKSIYIKEEKRYYTAYTIDPIGSNKKIEPGENYSFTLLASGGSGKLRNCNLYDADNRSLNCVF